MQLFAHAYLVMPLGAIVDDQEVVSHGLGPLLRVEAGLVEDSAAVREGMPHRRHVSEEVLQRRRHRSAQLPILSVAFLLLSPDSLATLPTVAKRSGEGY